MKYIYFVLKWLQIFMLPNSCMWAPILHIHIFKLFNFVKLAYMNILWGLSFVFFWLPMKMSIFSYLIGTSTHRFCLFYYWLFSIPKWILRNFVAVFMCCWQFLSVHGLLWVLCVSFYILINKIYKFVHSQTNFFFCVYDFYVLRIWFALPGWFRWLEHHLAHQKCAVSITGQGIDLGCGFDPQSLTWMFLSLSPSLSLKSINIYPQVRFSFFLIKRRNLILFVLYTLFSFFYSYSFKI